MSEPDLIAAWTDFHDRVAAAGRSILTDEKYPSDPRQQAEGLRYVTRLTQYALQRYVEFADPAHPAFFRFGDDVLKWGSPDSDNNYIRACVSTEHTYVVRGSLNGIGEVIVSIHEGDMPQGKDQVLAELTLEDLELGPDREIELWLGGEERESNWLPLPEGTDHVLIRQYLLDWEHDPVADLRIECLDPGPGLAPNLTPEALVAGLATAASWVETSVPFWQDYFATMAMFLDPNVMLPPRRPPGAAVNMLFGGLIWELDDDQALVIECERPVASYWSLQLSSQAWMETLDFVNRITSLNHTQVHVDDDDRFRIVVCAQDPGVQNWLDTTGLRTGLVAYRFVRPESAPAPTATVLPLSELRGHLPQSTPTYDEASRRAQVESRRIGASRRFRR